MKKVGSLATNFTCAVTLFGCGGNESGSDTGGEIGTAAENEFNSHVGEEILDMRKHLNSLSYMNVYQKMNMLKHYGAWTQLARTIYHCILWKSLS